MNHPSVQQTGAVSPGMEELRLLLYSVKIAGKAAAVTIALFFFDVAMFIEICDGTFYRGARKVQIGRDGIYGRPAFTL